MFASCVESLKLLALYPEHPLLLFKALFTTVSDLYITVLAFLGYCHARSA